MLSNRRRQKSSTTWSTIIKKHGQTSLKHCNHRSPTTLPNASPNQQKRVRLVEQEGMTPGGGHVQAYSSKLSRLSALCNKTNPYFFYRKIVMVKITMFIFGHMHVKTETTYTKNTWSNIVTHIVKHRLKHSQTSPKTHILKSSKHDQQSSNTSSEHIVHSWLVGWSFGWLVGWLVGLGLY
jgi:hypothetical protein